MAKLFANHGDPDQTPRSTASDLGLHYLPVTLLRVSRLQWVNVFIQHDLPYIQYNYACTPDKEILDFTMKSWILPWDRNSHAYGVEKSLCFLVSGKIDPISVLMWDKRGYIRDS